jgi:signal transduction histidine kinase
VLKNVGLTAELLQRLEVLRASRLRLVAAKDGGRRRLERNLHDGAQQNLVALKVKLGLAEAFAEKDPAKAALPVDGEADSIGRYPQDIEAAISFFVLEALQNVQTYAAPRKRPAADGESR